ncbi:MAG TPA: YkvA family protein [Intrasporangium sp.]|uniref:YkvA family protein n=1 Tax=Intrasporangium sp. TaxID=1925024 RepID=UPI002D787338|nr:YkvA family protein [Intrasporangium sp.]HET7399051.1 YkvA family protein [Intrasporangium sp.]
MNRLKLLATAGAVLRTAARPGAPGLSERVEAVPRLVRATLDGSYAGCTLGRLGLLAAAAAYVASPLDLLPEAVLPIVGAADDAVVASWAIKTFLEETDRFLAWERGQGRRPRRTVLRGTVVDASSAMDRSGRPDDDTPARPGPGLREAATTYVLESVRRRLER